MWEMQKPNGYARSALSNGRPIFPGAATEQMESTPDIDPSATSTTSHSLRGTAERVSISYAKVLAFVAANPGATSRAVSMALLGTASWNSDERKRVVEVLRFMAWGGLLVQTKGAQANGAPGAYEYTAADVDIQLDWRLRALGAEHTLARAEAATLDAVAEAKRWRDRCSVTVDDAAEAGLWDDLEASVRRTASWCSGAGVDPVTMATLLGVSQGPHDLINALAKHVGRPPFDVLAEILEVDA
jgi:hypothetical protein